MHIRKARVSDLEGCAICFGLPQSTYPTVYPQRLKNDSIPHHVRLTRSVKDLTRELNDPLKEFYVAIRDGGLPPEDDPAGSTIVMGYIIWQKPGVLEREVEDSRSKALARDGASDPDGRWADQSVTLDSSTMADRIDYDALLDKECDHELAGKLKDEKLAVASELCGYDSWFLQNLFVAPEFQRRGVGTALIEHGLGLIEKAIAEQAASTTRPVIALTSSPEGKKLYERYGFKDVHWFRPRFVDFDENGELREKQSAWPLMIKRDNVAQTT